MVKIGDETCPLCRAPPYRSDAEYLVHVHRHVQNEVPEAIYTLGKIYQEGALGISEKSSKKAVKLLKRAVELGCVEAMNALGLLYQRGEGVKKIDSKKSMQLYEMAADQGSHWGQHNLASLLYEEEIKKASPNHAEVFRYYKLAADQGLTEAEINLGMCYVHGYGVSADMNEARRWFVRAAAKGHEKAIFVLEELDRRLG
jgi:TPR repeat protein